MDTTFAKSHAWLAVALYEYGINAGAGTPAAAKVAVERAVALSPDDPDVLAARAWMRRFEWDWAGARADLSRAVELDRTSSWALYGLLVIEAALGNSDASVDAGRRSAEVDPVTAGDGYSIALRYAGRWDEALAATRAGLRVDSLSTANCWWCELAYVLAQRGDVDGTRAASAKAVTLSQRNPLYVEAIALARAGRTQEARARIPEMRRAMLSRGGPGSSMVAATFLAVGETDSAMVWLEKFVAGRPSNVHTVATNTFLAPLRTDPRYTVLLKRIGLR